MIHNRPVLTKPNLCIQGHEHYLPLVTYAALVGVWLNPLHVMHRSSRYWLLRILARVVAAPLVAVNFADFWLADQVR